MKSKNKFSAVKHKKIDCSKKLELMYITFIFAERKTKINKGV